MKPRYLERVNSCLKDIIQALPRGAADMLRVFTHQFYAKMPLADLERLDPTLAAAIARSAFAFFEHREKGAPQIRLFTPTMREHGYESHRLVVELLNDDMPFLVDSLTADLLRRGFTLHEMIHPILRVKRDRKGALTEVVQDPHDGRDIHNESLIHFELSPLPAGMSAELLKEDLERVLSYIRSAVNDWPTMTKIVVEAANNFKHVSDTHDAKTVEEARDFLVWLREKNFIFLGYADDSKKLGICALEQAPPAPRSVDGLVSVTKSDGRSMVHRDALMDVVQLSQPGRGGELKPGGQLVGLFTSSVYYQSADQIPLVRNKIARVLGRSGYDLASHDGKALKAILEFMPRDELFQYDEDELFETALGILALEARPGVRLFIRRDAHERFVSCLAFVPREYFTTDLRKTIMNAVSHAYQGAVEHFATQLSDSPLARLHFVLRTTPGFLPDVDIAAVESDIARATHLWSDELRTSLTRRFGEQQAESLFRTFSSSFPNSYTGRYGIDATVYDIAKCTEALGANGLVVDLYRLKDEPNLLHLKTYNPSEEIALSDILPVLENMGFRVIDEHPFLITPQATAHVWIRDFKLMLAEPEALTLDHVKPLLEDALLAVWKRTMENDRFNALVIRAGLSWRQVTMLRAYGRYLKQISFTYGEMALALALAAHPSITKLIVALFVARFDPECTDAASRQAYLESQLDAKLAEVNSLSDDRILRQYIALLRATMRTNYFQQNKIGESRPVLSFKFLSSAIPGIPAPVPFMEIFVYGVRVEGIHLRGGKVARGGLRWSDRAEDFRTEVLGLMKAQMVKNAVIVPVGSKGGFIVKQPQPTREAFQEEGVACYKMYLSGLLDITDNIVRGAVMPPERVVRHDEDDPYLVVAADKGTANFSDIANGVAQAYHFWLDDAFASGGSAGYDHKKMAITARGGWVSVTRHFREMGVDIANHEFTCVGIGDMAGDVFGNGMLLSDTMKLVAAFNHMHIFIDPTPDPKSSFEERKRLFNLPRSSWKDYDVKKISKGGGIFERSSKSISLSTQAKLALGIEQDMLTPDELIRAILTAQVDLLWNGGIGTYVKAEDETHDQVGDRANNAVRVNGRELRCKVVGEGGNLGLTQKGRIEYARMTGGHINTDAIDNSGGVDCSDHEVNIKIAFSNVLNTGKLSRDRRDQLLVRMTDEVAGLVLKDNILQTQAISLAHAQGAAMLESHARLMRRLEKQGLLNRALEFLPSDRQISELRTSGNGLTRPELAVLLAYAKIALYRELIESSLPDESYFAADLARYFPKPMQKDYAAEIEAHPLKREIIGTMVTNSLVNRAGIAFFFDIADDSNRPSREIAAAYTLARDAFSLRDLWADIEAQPNVDGGIQAEMLTAINNLVERVTLWCLRHLPAPISIESTITDLRAGIDEFRRALSTMHSPATREAYERIRTHLVQAGVSEALAQAIANLDMLASACDVIAVAHQANRSIASVGNAYFALEAQLGLGWLRANALSMRPHSHWDRLALRALVQDIFDEQRRITAAALAYNADSAHALHHWADAQTDILSRYNRFLEDLRTRETQELSALLVALKHVRML